MNEATHKDAKDNPEKTSGSLEEAKTKLKEELEKFQDAGEKILDQYENIAKIQKEIDENKKNIVELKVNENTKDKYSSPQSVFEEFKKNYRIKIKSKEKEKNGWENLFSPVSCIIIYVLLVLDLFFLCGEKIKDKNNILDIKVIIFFFIIMVLVFLLYKFLWENESIKKVRKIIDFVIFLIICGLIIYFTHAFIIEYAFLFELLGDFTLLQKIYLNIDMILLLILSLSDNSNKYYSIKEKEIATSIIGELFNDKTPVDFIKLLLKYKDEIKDDFIYEFKKTLLFKIFSSIGGGTLVLSIPQMLKIASLEGLLLFCMASLAVVLVVFCSCKSFFHEKELYFITLEDMLFKEVIKM